MARVTFVKSGKPTCARLAGHGLDCRDGYIHLGPGRDFVYGDRGIGAGDFLITARMSLWKYQAHPNVKVLPGVESCNAAFCFSGGDAWKRGGTDIRVSGFLPPEVRSHSRFGLGHEGQFFVDGPVFDGLSLFGRVSDWINDGEPLTLEVERKGKRLTFRIDGRAVREAEYAAETFGKVGLTAGQADMRLYDFTAEGELYELDWQRTQTVGHTLPVADVTDIPGHQVVLARGSETLDYQHPSTVLMADRQTMLCPWTHDHGGGCGPMKRSGDGGLTWEWVETPEQWRTVVNCPTIHRLTDPDGVERLVVQAGGNGTVMAQAVSEDGGRTWSDMQPNGLACTVAPITIEPISGGRHLSLFHDSRRIYSSTSSDGGLTWSEQRLAAEDPDAFLCEPVIIRSPDGKQLAAVMRENSRWFNAQIMFSDDEGESWSEPEELPGSLNGDRHHARYDVDGRIVMVFRDTGLCSSTICDFVGWVGTWEDLVEKREGQYRLRLIANSKYATCGATGYPGLERLPDGTFVATTYAVIAEGHHCSIVSVRFKLSETDALVE